MPAVLGIANDAVSPGITMKFSISSLKIGPSVEGRGSVNDTEDRNCKFCNPKIIAEQSMAQLMRDELFAAKSTSALKQVAVVATTSSTKISHRKKTRKAKREKAKWQPEALIQAH
jgi:hypothetical protein